MENYIIRPATLNDVDFLVETIIEAEKGGSDILTYTTLFGLSEADAKIYIAKMLEEEVDGCDLSLSGFLIAERNGEPAGALSGWIEGQEGISSVMIKGNLLNYCLPKESILQASRLSKVFSELSNVNFIPGSLWLGPVYVTPKHRGSLVLAMLCHQHIKNAKNIYPEVKEVFCAIFSNNMASILNYKMLKFEVLKEYVATSPEVNKLLPSNKKVIMHKTI
jgi:hypothetical protein